MTCPVCRVAECPAGWQTCSRRCRGLKAAEESEGGMTVGSLFSGVGGFDLGFERAGFDVRWQVEIEPFCQCVLSRHWPMVDRFDDVTRVSGAALAAVDVICAGVPCQDWSIAGRRVGIDGARSGLFFHFVRLVREMSEATHGRCPTMVVFENVPGLFSAGGGRDFHTVLTALDECGLDLAWRVLDSQYFGVAQRRRRVFLVGCARASGIDPAQILFESVGGGGDSASSHTTRAHVAASLRGRAHNAGVSEPGRGGEDDVNLVIGETLSHALTTTHTRSGRMDPNGETFVVAGALGMSKASGGWRCGPDEIAANQAVVGTYTAGAHPGSYNGQDAYTGHLRPALNGVRRLTPLECERLQGFPDGWTCLCGEGHRGTQHCTCPDTPRYKALGNAVTVSVVERIAAAVADALKERAA